MQWAALPLPPAILVSALYVLAVRKRVNSAGLRSHLDWQLATVGMSAAAFVLGAALFAIGMSGINTDAPVAIIATFVLVGLASAFPVWLLYRLIWGTLRYSRQLPMQRLLP